MLLSAKNFLGRVMCCPPRRYSACRQAAAFLAQSPDAYLITTAERHKELGALLPPDVMVLEQTPYFLKGEQLIVLNCPRPGAELSRNASLAAPPLAPTSPNNLR